MTSRKSLPITESHFIGVFMGIYTNLSVSFKDSKWSMYRLAIYMSHNISLDVYTLHTAEREKMNGPKLD